MQSVCNLSNVTYKKTNPIPNKLKIKKKTEIFVVL